MISFLSLVLMAAGAAEKDVDAIEDVSILELLEGETSVSSTKTTRLRDAPGIVTVITREDILRVGARDVGELLPLVPGFDLHAEVFGVVGDLFRGLYASDGRTLILVDGVEMNDNAYGGAYMFARYPIDDVERVEILRGPGSARYGGYASLTVIHIITRGNARRGTGAGVAASYGITDIRAPLDNKSVGAFGGTFLDVAGGLDLSLSAHAGTRAQSRRGFTDSHGTTASLADVSETGALLVNAAARLPWLHVRLLVENYSQESVTVYDTLQERPGVMYFPAVYLDVQAPLHLAPGLIVTPRLFATRQLPWRPSAAADFSTGDFREVDDRVRLGTQARWEALPRLTFFGGVDGTIDNAAEPTGADRDDDRMTFDYGSDVDRYFNGAAYGETVVDTDLFLVLAGARGELHSVYGSSFVPRVALTRAFDGAHAKLLVAGSFRAPAIDNIRFAQAGILPERTRVIELEGGVALPASTYLTVNVFDITIHDPMIYFVNTTEDGQSDGYANFPQTGTRGVEATLLGTAPFGRLELSYSFATADGKNQVPLYAVPGDDGRLLAAPQHKGVIIASLFLARGVTATMTGVLRSERATQVATDADLNAVYGELPASLMVGGALRITVVRDVEAVLGVRNALAEDFRIAQPYASGHGPLPIDDREIYVRLAGHFGEE